MATPQLSRRDFLKLTASGALGLVLSELGLGSASAAPPASKGLALFSGVPIRDAPSVKANKIELIGKDQSFDLLGEAQGDYFDNPHNTTWYAMSIPRPSCRWRQITKSLFINSPKAGSWRKSACRTA